MKAILLGIFWGLCLGGQTLAEPLRPLPARPRLDAKLVGLGKQLFHDSNLSKHRDVSCASCHPMDRGGADGLALSQGTGGAITAYNTPSVLNAAVILKYGWEGASATLEEATRRAMKSPRAMDLSAEDAGARLQRDPQLIVNALIAYMQAAVPRNSPLDRYLEGDHSALQAEQKEGYQRFIELGCVSCHQGVGVGGNMFVRFGVMVDLFRHEIDGHNGRYNVTRQECDRHVFRVPSLRNVAVTAPYFHDGRAPDLVTAVRTMAYVQLGIRLTDDDLRKILAFLGSLTGELPPEVLP